MFQLAFQPNAFQNSAFQTYPFGHLGLGGDDAPYTKEELARIQKIGKKIEVRQRALEKATKDGNAARKSAIKQLVDPVVKVKQTKVQLKQEVKADIPLAVTEDLERSISYLERQRDNILEAVAYRKQQNLIQEQLLYIEAKRQEELDDEAALLLLLH
jgi:hypothetical protein